MATKRNFYLDGKLIEPPQNADEISIQFNFDKDAAAAKQSISVTELVFVRENIDAIYNHFNSGRIFEGLPFKYEIENNGVKEIPFNGYLDLSEGARLSPEGCTVTAKELHKTDWLNDVSDSVSFEYLASIGAITSDNYISVPYVISSLPNYQSAFICGLSVAYITQSILAELATITEIITSMIGNPFEYTAVLRLIIRVAFLVGFVVALVVMVKEMVFFLVQPVKYHACMRVKDLATIGAAHFGLTFKSDLFDSTYKDLVIMPQKSFNPPNDEDSRILGYTTEDKRVQIGYPRCTYGEFLTWMKLVFKAKVIITDAKELILVREDYSAAPPQFQLPDLYEPSFSTNAHELKANYLIEFQTDLNDKNTIQEYKGTSFQVITSQINTVPQELNLLKDLEQVTQPFALAKRKTELTGPEKTIKHFAEIYDALMNPLISAINKVQSVINGIIRAINFTLKVLKAISFGKINPPFHPKPLKRLEPVNLEAVIENRIGMLKLENEFLMVPKLFTLSIGSESKFNKIPESNNTTVSAKALWENYHGPVVSFVPSTSRPNANQYIVKEFDKVPFEFGDFPKIKTNNHCYTHDGKEAIIDSGEWFFNSNRQDAKMKVRINQLYTNKLKETYLEPDGQ